MLTLIANEEYNIEIDEKLVIPFHHNNPFLSNELSYSFPFTIPWSYKNEKYFRYMGRAHRFEQKTTKIPLRIQFGVFNVTGIMHILALNNDKRYEAVFYSNEGALYEEMADTLLNELDYGGIRTIVDPDPLATIMERILDYYTSLKGKIWPEVDYNLFPVRTGQYNEHFADPRHREFINHWNWYTEKFSDWGLNNTRRNAIPVSPFLFINTVIDYVFKNFDLKIVSNDLAKIPEACRTVLISYYISTAGTPYVNYQNLVPPGRTVKEFLKGVEDKFNVTFYVNYKTREVHILDNNRALLGETVKDVTSLSSNVFQLTDKRYAGILASAKASPGNIGPEKETWAEYLSQYGEPIVIYSEIQLPLSPASSDLGKIYYVQSTGMFIRVQYSEESEETAEIIYQPFSSDLFNVKAGDEESEIEIDGTSLPEQETAKEKLSEFWEFYIYALRAVSKTQWRVPASTVRNFGVENPNTTFPITFAYYYFAKAWGTLGFPSIYDYPQGIIANKDSIGAPIPGISHSLKYYGDDNLAITRHKNRIAFIQHGGSPVERQIHFTPEDLLTFKFWHQLRIDNENYLAESIKINFSMLSMEIENVVLYPAKLMLTDTREIRIMSQPLITPDPPPPDPDPEPGQEYSLQAYLLGDGFFTQFEACNSHNDVGMLFNSIYEGSVDGLIYWDSEGATWPANGWYAYDDGGDRKIALIEDQVITQLLAATDCSIYPAS